MKDVPREPQDTPEPQDYAAAKLEWLNDNPDRCDAEWEKLPTRKRNYLAKQQMYHRGYSDLCDAIMNFRRK